jgi:hypothetical protein
MWKKTNTILKILTFKDNNFLLNLAFQIGNIHENSTFYKNNLIVFEPQKLLGISIRIG